MKEKSGTVLVPLQIWENSGVQESSPQNIKSCALDQTKDLSSMGSCAWTCNSVSTAKHSKLGDLQLGRNKEKWKHVNQLHSRCCKYIRAKPCNCATRSG